MKLVEHGYKPKDASRPPGSPDIPFASFPLIGDETQSLSCHRAACSRTTRDAR